MKTFVAIALTIALAAFAWAIAADDEDAMEKCQRTHSFDTCFHSLHR